MQSQISQGEKNLSTTISDNEIDSNMSFNLRTLLFMTGFLICSCQSAPLRQWKSADLVLSDETTVESITFPQLMTSSKVADDIDFLIYVLKNGYGGRNYAPEDSFAEAIEALRAIPASIGLSELHQKIDESLFIIPDNHLRCYYLGRVSKRRQDYEDKSKGNVGRNNISDPSKIWETRIDRVGNKKVLYISIVRFPSSESDIWKGFISSVSSQMKKSDSIVIDLRGNSGGDDAVGMELAEVLFGHPIEHPIKRQYRRQSPEVMALAINRYVVDLMNIKYDGQKVPDYLVRELKESKERYLKAAQKEIPPELIRTDKGTGNRFTPITGYKKPIYILMDRSCGSSCEFTIAAFEWNKYVKKVGENTNGSFHFSNAGTAVLPNSKFRVIVPSQYNEFYDQRFIERIGFSPDVKVPSGEDAYVQVKKIIGSE